MIRGMSEELFVDIQHTRRHSDLMHSCRSWLTPLAYSIDTNDVVYPTEDRSGMVIKPWKEKVYPLLLIENKTSIS